MRDYHFTWNQYTDYKLVKEYYLYTYETRHAQMLISFTDINFTVPYILINDHTPTWSMLIIDTVLLGNTHPIAS